MTSSPTTNDTLRSVAKQLQKAGVEYAEFEARLIITHALNISRSELIEYKDKGLSGKQVVLCQTLAKRRSNREPMAYLTGEKEFWSLPFIVSQQALIPRPDSETLIHAVVGHVSDYEKPKRILDIGTGTGCLLASLLTEWPFANGVGIDISAGAVYLAQKNLETLGLQRRSKIFVAEWPFYQPSEKFDIVMSNPPYVPTNDIQHLDPGVREYEPITALDGGADGLALHRELANHAKMVLRLGGLIAVEFGIGQSDDIQLIYSSAGFSQIQIHADLNGIERCLLATLEN